MADAQSDYLTEKQLLLKRDPVFKCVEDGHAQLVGQDGVGRQYEEKRRTFSNRRISPIS